eukprot:12645175-Alexandrium_andersonii.AAC.1
MPGPQLHPPPCHLPAQRHRQVMEVAERRQVHVGLAGIPPTGPHVTREVASHDDKVAAERRRHGIRG